MQLSRRSLLQMTGLIGAGAAATYLAGCTPKPGPAAGNNNASSGTTPKISKDIPKDAVTDDLIFDGWAFEVDIVQDNVKKFNDAYGEKVTYSTIPGDYPSIMENMLINKSRLDMMYGFPQEAARFYRAGWLHDFEQYWDASDIKGQLYDSVRKSAMVDGKLVGLPYFTSVNCTIWTNEKSLAAAGSSSYPETWKELFDKARALKGKGGVDYPFLPKWIPTWFGIAETFVLECLNRNIPLFDDKYQPVFDENSDAAGLLEEWRGLIVDKIVPEHVLTMSETDFIDAFAKGGYHFSAQQFYDGKVMNDPARSNIAGKSRFLPVTKQPWGMMETAFYLVPKYKGDDEKRLSRKYRLAGYFGYKDDQGQLGVTKRWAIHNGLGSGYKAILDDPDVVATYKKWLPDERLLDDMKVLYEKAPWPEYLHATWWSEWNAKAVNELVQAVAGQKPVKDVIKGLRTTALELIDRYK